MKPTRRDEPTQYKDQKKKTQVSEKSTHEIDESRGPNKKKECDTVGLKNKKKST